MKISNEIKTLLKNFLDEDIGSIDITTQTIFDEDFIIIANLIAKEKCILAGIPFFKEVFLIVDRSIKFSNYFSDGAKVKSGSNICELRGKLKSILKAERVALNIISHLSGIATYTNEFVRQTSGKFKVLDTRKTLPGLRKLEKYAVRIGGGYNHRMNLSEMILIKDNHINLWARHRKTIRTNAISELVSKAKNRARITVEVEVEKFEEAIAATQAGADILMFDNADICEIRKFLKNCGGNRPLIEVSGGIDVLDIKKFKNLDIDFVSVGRITHSAPAIDFSLEISQKT